MKPQPDQPTNCTKCKSAIGDNRSIIYLGPERDPERLIPLCHACAILGCFRCGLPGVK